jgi:hypothetical protein
MSPEHEPPTEPQSAGGPAARSLRLFGVVVFVMFLLTSAIGGSLALESSYLAVTLASHIGLALITLGIAGYATSVVGRSYRAPARASAGVAALAALGATIAGTVFLLDGSSNSALYAMEGLAVVGILAAIVMIVAGGSSGLRAPSETSRKA